MDKVVEDVANGIRDWELSRLHYTHEMVDLNTFREDYRYVFRNAGTRSLKAVPLLWRRRHVQANMYVRDAADANLVYLPSELTNLAMETHLKRILRTGFRSVINPAVSLADLLELVHGAVEFESAYEARRQAYQTAVELARQYPTVPQLTDAAVYLALLLEYYLPSAILNEAVAPGDFAFVRHGVDLYLPAVQREIFEQRFRRWAHLHPRRITPVQLAWFLLRGRLKYRVPIPLDALSVAGAKSYHLRLSIPAGLRVLPPIRLEPDSVLSPTLLGLASHDDNNAYMYLGSRELVSAAKRRVQEAGTRQQIIQRIYRSLRAFRDKFPRVHLPQSFAEYFRMSLLWRLEEAKKVRLELWVRLGIARGMWPLLGLLWVIAGGTALTAFLGALDPSVFLSFLGLLLVAVLTIGIFALDKRILRELVSAHVILSVLVSIGAFILPRVV